jgi:hypothetical protein
MFFDPPVDPLSEVTLSQRNIVAWFIQAISIKLGPIKTGSPST